MKYYVEIGESAQKEIDNLKDNILKKNITNKIKQLANNPRKGKFIFANFYELKAKNYRIYYAIYKGIIVIEKVEYSGKVIIRKIGTKDSQKRDISDLNG